MRDPLSPYSISRPLLPPGALFVDQSSNETYIVHSCHQDRIFAWPVGENTPDRMRRFGREVLTGEFLHVNFEVYHDRSVPYLMWTSFKRMWIGKHTSMFDNASDDIWYSMFPQGRVWDINGDLYTIIRSEPRGKITLRAYGFKPLLWLTGRREIHVDHTRLLFSASIRYDN